VAKLTGKNLPVSSIRVKKFASSTEFRSSKGELDGFEAPFAIEDGLRLTLQSEFISPTKNGEVFYTE